ncbi:SDR family NAD(P)-dependent oxidoreductase [Brevibacillus ginsengisoli]|uniref:SDR family NAD(P)-dependent oxidoreductase n=1 Tax=Brevibacillus ginsengisoli TaxID=363854 RepID=UPI003CE82B4E
MSVRKRMAIVGLSCRLPGANFVQQWREMLSSGRTAIGKLPTERFDAGWYRACWGLDIKEPLLGALVDVPELNARTMPIPPDQTKHMHPMEKVGLTIMHEALQDAGIARGTSLARHGRIFMAAHTLGPAPDTDHGPRIRQGEFSRLLEQVLQDHYLSNASSISQEVMAFHSAKTPPILPDTMTTSASLMAGRIANLYDIQGGHIAINAGVCSSLAAVEEAMRALQQNACDFALVAGISPLITASCLLEYLGDSSISLRVPALGEGGVAMVLLREEDIEDKPVYGFVEGISSSAIAIRNDEHEIAEATRKAAMKAIQLTGIDPRRVTNIRVRNDHATLWGLAERSGLSLYYGHTASNEHIPLMSAVPHVGYLQSAAGLVELMTGILHLDNDNVTAINDVGIAPVAYHALISRGDTTTASERKVGCIPPVSEQEPIAIVGMGVIVPGAAERDAFWKHTLLNYKSIGDLPKWKWSYEKVIGSNKELATISPSRLAGVVQMPHIDGQKSGYSSEDLRPLDGGVILSMLSGIEAGQQAGIMEPTSDKSRLDVIIGQLPVREAENTKNKQTFFTNYLKDVQTILSQQGLSHTEIGNVLQKMLTSYQMENAHTYDYQLSSSGIANAHVVAKALGAQGTILSVDAACASSLAALELGIRRLHAKEADAVLVGGVAYHLVPEYNLTLQLLGALSTHGIPPFHRDSDGFVPAEGAGAVVIKRLSDALRDGNQVYAVLRGIGCSSDGKGASVLAPSSKGQIRAIEQAMRQANVIPQDIDHVEAHGTGTRLGDDTEINTYRQVFGERPDYYPYTIGAIKSQIGHLSSASGIIGLIKTTMALHNKVIPPSYVDERSALLIPELASEPRVWGSREDRKRRAGVSAFGMGGINYFAIIEEAEVQTSHFPARLSQPLPALLKAQQCDRFTVELVPVSLPKRAPLFPLSGKRFLLIQDNGDKWEMCEKGLEEKGAVVCLLTLDKSKTETQCYTYLQRWEQQNGVIDGVIDMRLLQERPELLSFTADELALEIEKHSDHTFMLLRYFYDRFEQAATLSTCYIALTCLGGNLGVTDCDEGNVLGSFMLGLLKSLKQELPAVLAKTIDFPAHEPIERVISQMIREVEDGNERMEVAYTDRRFVVHHKNANFTDKTTLARTISQGDVFLFTGGGRGVVFECAKALAQLGATVIVCGRTTITDHLAPWLEMTAEEFADYERNQYVILRRQDPSITLAQCKKRLLCQSKERELHQNLKKAKELGITYEVCDITQKESVHQLIDRIIRKHRRIDGIIHGAMVEWSTILPKKTKDMVDHTLRTKVTGMCHLLDATKELPLRSFMCFGSGAGRFGNKGQADYSAANSLMASLLIAKCRQRTHPLHHVTLNWTAWESVGAAVSDPSITHVIKQNGVPFTSTHEGIYWFLHELACGREKETLIAREDFLQRWPAGGTEADGKDERTLAFQDNRMPVNPGAWPFIDRILDKKNGAVQVERSIRVDKDRYLAQHCLDQIPIFPMVCYLEMLAEAAALLSPGYSLHSVQQFEVFHPTKLYANKPVNLRAEAIMLEDKAEIRVLRARALSDVTVSGRLLEKDRVNAEATFTFHKEEPRLLPKKLPTITGASYSGVLYHTHRETLQIGPLFCRASEYTMNAKQGVATAAPPDDRKLFSFTSAPTFQVDPFLLDVSLQIADSIDTFGSGVVSLPISIGSVRFGRRRGSGERVRVYGEMTQQQGTELLFDILVIGENGETIMEINAFLARRIMR